MLVSVLGHSEAALGTNDPINKRQEIQDSLTNDLSVFFTRSHKQFVSHCPVFAVIFYGICSFCLGDRDLDTFCREFAKANNPLLT